MIGFFFLFFVVFLYMSIIFLRKILIGRFFLVLVYSKVDDVRSVLEYYM